MVQGLLEYRGVDARMTAIDPSEDSACDDADDICFALMVRVRDFARAESILKTTFTDL
ncbi:MAG: hypothetical protein KKG33_13780 [candidate division Zixibacteria bacterium]|nr:hypothetical protein [candidate division Zixibacteria bacterium]